MKLVGGTCRVLSLVLYLHHRGCYLRPVLKAFGVFPGLSASNTSPVETGCVGLFAHSGFCL